jgi:hypothetical protein
MPKHKQKRGTRTAKGKVKFDQRLILVNWMLDLFGVATFEDLAKHMCDPSPFAMKRIFNGQG